jgi:hypothetical protein
MKKWWERQNVIYRKLEASIVVHASTCEAEAGGLQVVCQLGLHSENLSQLKKRKKERKKTRETRLLLNSSGIF